MHEPAGDARDQQLVVDLQLDGVLQLLPPLVEHGVELLGLRYGAGEAVEDEAGDERGARLVCGVCLCGRGWVCGYLQDVEGGMV